MIRNLTHLGISFQQKRILSFFSPDHFYLFKWSIMNWKEVVIVIISNPWELIEKKKQIKVIDNYY